MDHSTFKNEVVTPHDIKSPDNEKWTELNASKSSSSVTHGQLIAYSNVDPVLAINMQLVNDAINEIGFMPYHWKLFFLNGFGYAVDSLLAFLMSITAGQVALELRVLGCLRCTWWLWRWWKSCPRHNGVLGVPSFNRTMDGDAHGCVVGRWSDLSRPIRLGFHP